MIPNTFDNSLIVFEGIDGTGKTTISKMLAQFMNEQALSVHQSSRIDFSTQEFLKRQLGDFVERRSLEWLCATMNYGGAVRFEDLQLKDITYQLKQDGERKFGINFRYLTFLLSALQKERVVRVLLPYTNVIMDRYVYSVVAHHSVYGATTDCVDVQRLPITEPDYYFLMVAGETERQDRIARKLVITEGDKRLKLPGSDLEQIETVFKGFHPILVDTTGKEPETTLEEVAGQINNAERRERILKARTRGHPDMVVFDNERYLDIQLQAIVEKMQEVPAGGSVYIEFGGKTFDDQHAARLLPGYHPDLKMKLLKRLSESVEIVVAVSARDLLRPRIRGDSQQFYARETIRLIVALGNAGIATHHGVITMVRDDYGPDEKRIIEEFIETSRRELNIWFITHGFIDGYPEIGILDRADPFSRSPKLPIENPNVLVLSPGGGSGKFSVCLSQLYHDFKAGINSLYIKFETFPVFNLPPGHPVNAAFAVATADLMNEVIEESPAGLTSYDKDIENFGLLAELVHRHAPQGNPMMPYRYPSDMGINRLTCGFMNEPAIAEAAIQEIQQRIKRYTEEAKNGVDQQSTLDRALSLAAPFLKK